MRATFNNIVDIIDVKLIIRDILNYFLSFMSVNQLYCCKFIVIGKNVVVLLIGARTFLMC